MKRILSSLIVFILSFFLTITVNPVKASANEPPVEPNEPWVRGPFLFDIRLEYNENLDKYLLIGTFQNAEYYPVDIYVNHQLLDNIKGYSEKTLAIQQFDNQPYEDSLYSFTVYYKSDGTEFEEWISKTKSYSGKMGLPFNPGEYTPETEPGLLGTVEFNVNGYNLDITINYRNKPYQLSKKFTAETDMSIFNASEAYYINIDNNPQIIINNSDRLHLKDLINKPNAKPTFIPHTIWHLKSNKLESFSTYDTFVYTKMTKKSAVVAYVYIDEFIMDKMLSISLSYTYMDYKNWLSRLINGENEWITVTEEFTHEDSLIYQNRNYRWWELIRYPLIEIIIRAQKHELPRINPINFNNLDPEYNITEKELNDIYMGLKEDFTGMKQDPRYKPYAITLQQGRSDWLGNKTILYDEDPTDERYFSIMNITYMTDGKIYEAVGDEMDILYEQHPGLSPKEPRESNWSKIIAIVILALYPIVLIQSKAFTNIRKFLTTTLIYGIVVVAAVILFKFVI